MSSLLTLFNLIYFDILSFQVIFFNSTQLEGGGESCVGWDAVEVLGVWFDWGTLGLESLGVGGLGEGGQGRWRRGPVRGAVDPSLPSSLGRGLAPAPGSAVAARTQGARDILI